jgi:hypothetical protein
MLTDKKRVEYAMCVANEGSEDLEVWKVYRILPDPKATEVGCIRVIDESGEDYLHPADRFVTVDFPEHVRERLPRSHKAIATSKAAPTTAKLRRTKRHPVGV